MVKLDHLALVVRDVRAARDWYVGNLGLRVEFDVAERRTVAPQKLFWGYGAELDDPDGYRIGLWDEKSMCEKG